MSTTTRPVAEFRPRKGLSLSWAWVLTRAGTDFFSERLMKTSAAARDGMGGVARSLLFMQSSQWGVVLEKSAASFPSQPVVRSAFYCRLMVLSSGTRTSKFWHLAFGIEFLQGGKIQMKRAKKQSPKLSHHIFITFSYQFDQIVII